MATSLTMNDFSFYEPMRKNWYILQFSEVPGVGEDGEKRQKGLTLACKSCTTPHLTTAVNELHRINDIVYTPGKSAYDTINASFYEFIKNKETESLPSAGQLLYDWQQKVHDPSTGKQGTKKEIASNLAIVQINGDGEVVRTWNVYNCWPTDVTFGDLDSASGDTMDVSFTLRYDWAKLSGDFDSGVVNKTNA